MHTDSVGEEEDHEVGSFDLFGLMELQFTRPGPEYFLGAQYFHPVHSGNCINGFTLLDTDRVSRIAYEAESECHRLRLKLERLAEDIYDLARSIEDFFGQAELAEFVKTVGIPVRPPERDDGDMVQIEIIAQNFSDTLDLGIYYRSLGNSGIDANNPIEVLAHEAYKTQYIDYAQEVYAHAVACGLTRRIDLHYAINRRLYQKKLLVERLYNIQFYQGRIARAFVFARKPNKDTMVIVRFRHDQVVNTTSSHRADEVIVLDVSTQWMYLNIKPEIERRMNEIAK